MTILTVRDALPVALARYDEHDDFYVSEVDAMLADPNGFWEATLRQFDERLATRVPGKVVLDVACGEGHLSRRLYRYAPAHLSGVDISHNLLSVARERGQALNIDYRHDDAHVLHTVEDASVDVAVSFLALMDIPDHCQLFSALRRVLRPGGVLLFSMMHPCFESPFYAPECPQFMHSEHGKAAYIIRRYATEGFWESGKDGVRGKLGSYHRTLSTLFNDLMAAGFCVQYLGEPLTSSPDLFSEVPRVMVVEARAL